MKWSLKRILSVFTTFERTEVVYIGLPFFCSHSVPLFLQWSDVCTIYGEVCVSNSGSSRRKNREPVLTQHQVQDSRHFPLPKSPHSDLSVEGFLRACWCGVLHETFSLPFALHSRSTQIQLQNYKAFLFHAQKSGDFLSKQLKKSCGFSVFWHYTFYFSHRSMGPWPKYLEWPGALPLPSFY